MCKKLNTNDEVEYNIQMIHKKVNGGDTEGSIQQR